VLVVTSTTTRETIEIERVREELRTTQAQVEAFINNATVAFLVCDREGRLLRVNHTFETLFGWTAEEALGMTLPFVPDSHFAAYRARLQNYNTEMCAYEAWRQRKDNSLFVASETVTPICNAEGAIDSFAIAMRDITDRKKAERRVQESEQRYKSLFEQNSDAIFSLDFSGRFLSVNPAVEQTSGYTPSELLNKPYTSIMVPEDVALAQQSFERAATQGEPEQTELTIFHKHGHRVELSVNTMPIVIDQEIVGVYGIAKDITEKKRAEHLINHMAYHDSLTDLPNRRLFKDRLTQALEQTIAHEEQLAILFIDLDRFKIINDSLGHAFGDLVLQCVAERLSSCVREHDLVARMGGDEFTVLLPKLADSEDVLGIAQRLLETINQPMEINGQELHITPSIGISRYPQDGQDTETLMKHADTAMYKAKETGKNNFQFYAPTMNMLAFEQMELENELRKALERQEFVLYYQPQVNVSTGKIIGMEALIRWQHPDKGLLAPGHFISIAEENGMIVPIGEWVLRQACHDCKSWQAAGLPPIRVAVNLSLIQFQKNNLCETVTNILEETGLDPQYLELEITESIAMQNTDQVIQKLEELVNLGIEISIDDFGTGFSSLSYLKKFPIHKLKIDRSFVSDITTDPDDASIVSAIIAMALSLKLDLIVEGVETKEQQNYLHELGCHEMQGFLFSRPVPGTTVTSLLSRGV
jgi:diguanylate cyclase (GGDEF)-like protein/PAS domain S-box-containing protein